MSKYEVGSPAASDGVRSGGGKSPLRGLQLTAAALGRLPKAKNSSRRSRRSSASATLSMFNVLKKMKNERQKARQDRRGHHFSVLQKSKDSLTHLESAMKSDVLQPDATWRQVWDLIIIFLIMYYWIFVPMLYVTRRENLLLTPAWHFVIEVVCTLIFTADVGLQFNTATIEADTGIVHHDKTKIRQLYLYGTFTWDFLSALPLDLLFLATLGEDYDGRWVYVLVSHLRLLKLMRVATLFKIVNSLKLDSQVVHFHYGIVPNVKMAFWCVVALHVITVFFMLMNKNDTFSTEEDLESYTYTTSLYWTLYTVSSVGYGDISVNTPWKRRFASLLCVVGVILHGVVISEISSRMQKGDVQSERRDKMKETLNIMHVFSIPEELQKEVFAFQYHQLHSSMGGQFMKVLDTLPSSMRNRVDLYVRVKFICKVPMFAEQEMNCLVDLANGLRNLIFEPEEVIINAGDDGREMYFLAHGFGDVLSPQGQHWGVIRPGGFFGEMALLSSAKRNATIRALTYCDLFMLQKEKFMEIMEKYPGLEYTVKNEVKRREAAAGNVGESSPEEEKPLPMSEQEMTDRTVSEPENNLETQRSAESYSPTSDVLRAPEHHVHQSYEERPMFSHLSVPDVMSGGMRRTSGDSLPMISMTPPVTEGRRSSLNIDGFVEARLTQIEDKLETLIKAVSNIESVITRPTGTPPAPPHHFDDATTATDAFALPPDPPPDDFDDDLPEDQREGGGAVEEGES